MTQMQIGIWEAATFCALVLSTVAGIVIWAGKMLLQQVERRLDQRFESLERNRDSLREQCMQKFGRMDGDRREEVAQWQRVERDLLQLRADLPLHYVRREDYVRGQTIIEAKMDAIALKIENLQLRNSFPGDRRGAPRPNPTTPTEETHES